MKTMKFLAALSLLAAFHLGQPAQADPVYKRGATYLENTMPPSPGPASAVKYIDVPFSYSAGMAEYDIPFYTLEGRELSIPVGLHYASGGIKLDEIAGVAGLGWTLEAGGCITRTVRDMPDEFSAAAFRHELPSGELLENLKNGGDSNKGNNAVMNYLLDILCHEVDSSLDSIRLDGFPHSQFSDLGFLLFQQSYKIMTFAVQCSNMSVVRFQKNIFYLCSR